MTTPRRACHGFTLIEIIVASLIAALIAAGTMTAFMTAARIMRAQGHPGTAEAAGYAQGTIERFRNMIACDSPWFDPTSCSPDTDFPTTWTDDPLPTVEAGSESILSVPGATRRYCFTIEDCDQDGAAGDCYALHVKMCWFETSCPAVGSSCS